MIRKSLVAALPFVLLIQLPGTATAQASWLFPDRSLLPDLLAGARDPVVKGQLVYSAVDPTRYGGGFAGDVALAGTLPVLLLAVAPDQSVVVGLEAAVFARFSFQVIERELVNSDWVFAVPLVWRRSAHWLRLRYYHTSSHLGDEYWGRFGDEPVNFARDGADFTAYVRLHPAVGIYGVGFLSVNAHPVRSHGSHVRAGVEVDPGQRAPWRVFAAADIQAEGAGTVLSRLSAQAGLWLPHPSDRPLRLALDLTTGRSAMGQFHGLHATQLALGLLWNP
jgi:hypothetical protein